MKFSRVMIGLIGFFFFCTMYGLYKYILIDVDYIFQLHDGEDYGIDVRTLRENAKILNQTETSGLLRWDKVVEKANGKHIAYIADNCDMPTQIYGVGYLIKGVRNSLQAVIQVNYTSDHEISAQDGEAYVFVRFGNLVMMNQTLGLCELDEEVMSCPIPKGFRSYYRKQQLPKYAPRGRYRAYVELRYKESKKVKICAKGQLVI